jgi:hypothetical protein
LSNCKTTVSFAAVATPGRLDQRDVFILIAIFGRCGAALRVKHCEIVFILFKVCVLTVFKA